MKKFTCLLLIVSLIFTMMPFMDGKSKAYADAGDTYTLNMTGSFDYASAHQMLKDINSARTAEGVGTLQLDKTLTDYAMQRAAEIAYFYSHTRPNRTEWYTVGQPRVNAENIAYGYPSGNSVFEGWMNSEGHRANILHSEGKAIGIGHVTHMGKDYWVQLFSAATGTEETRTMIATETRSIEIVENGYPLFFTDYKNEGNEYLEMDQYATYDLSVSALNQGVVEGNSIAICNFDTDSFHWTTADATVASVDADGVVTANQVGSTTITATSKKGGRKVSIHVNIKKNLSRAVCSDLSEETYTGSEIRPAVTIKYDGDTLVENRDYTLSYQNNIDAGWASVTYTGLGIYRGSVTKYFNIKRRDISSDVKVNLKGWNYKGYDNANDFLRDNLIITCNGKELSSSEDYSVYPTCDENKKDILSYILYFSGNYIGGFEAKSLENARIEGLATSYYYTGSPVKLKLNIYTADFVYKLVENVDYKIVYQNNIKGGTATATLVPLGNNFGTCKITFKIEYPRYIVKFNANNGTVSQTSKVVTVQSKYGSLPKAERVGYKFNGWYTKKTGGTKITSSTICKLKKEQTLYAHWEKVKVNQAVIKSLKRLSGKKLKVTVKKDSTVKGYQVKIATNSKFSKNVKTLTGSTNTKTFKNLKKTRYYVKVRAYKIDSAGKRVYGKYSKVKTMKIK